MSATDVSTLRLYLLRALYLMNFAFLAVNTWPALFAPAQPLGPLDGTAFSFWAALSTLCALGLRYPLQMLPLLLLQLLYKLIWLLAVALPFSTGGGADPLTAQMTKTFAGGAIADLIVIPWGYVLAYYVRKPGDRWKFRSAA